MFLGGCLNTCSPPLTPLFLSPSPRPLRYTADENGYRAEVKESLEAPQDLQAVEDNRAKYEVREESTDGAHPTSFTSKIDN